MWTELALSTLLLYLSLAKGDIDVNIVEKCCILGSDWSNSSSRRCPPFPTEYMNVPEPSTEACLTLTSICCAQSARHQQCLVGRDIARSQSSCSSITVQGANTDIYNYRKECCQCCQLGMFAADRSRSCEIFERSGKICDKSPDCCEAFYSCCNSSVSQSGNFWHGTTPTSTTPSPDSDPIHLPGGICSKFSSALCQHFCHDAPDRPNKFRCTCRRGYELAPNQRNCIQSEVSPTCESKSPCDSSAECYMRGGLPMCRCPLNGFRLVGGTVCEDVDECLQGLDTCTDRERCENTIGGFTCVKITCQSGTVYDPASRSCISDRAKEQPYACRRDEIYDHYLSTCVPARPATQQCPHGYAFNVLSGQCEDIDECAIGQDNCETGQRCENTPGSFTCRRYISCGTGYTLQEESQACVDINECQLGTHNCGPAFTCQNLPGSFRCEYKTCPPGQRLNLATGACVGSTQCRAGFSWDDFTRSCKDVNECLIENPCVASEQCINTEGSYRCQSQSKLRCYSGFELNEAGTSCVDINECERGLHNCQSRDACQNLQGSYRCQCDVGYSLNSVSNVCEDINECSRVVGQYCSGLNSECINTQGSYYCKCKEGFESISNGKACQDVNECLIPNICEHTCHNIWGSHQCRCRPGFRLADDKRTCLDVNECEMAATKGRLCNGFCENIPGSFRCTCPPGFRLSDNGRECLDIDECTEGFAGCNGPDQVCINTRGSFKCNVVSCPRYFQLASDSLSRTTVRCARKTFVCSQGDVECLTAPLSISYNFLTLRASRIRIPTELFTMRGPDAFPRIEFYLNVSDVRNNARDTVRVTRENFELKVDPLQRNVAIISVVLPIQGRQDIELKLNMNIFNEDGFFGTATASITIYATVDPWEDFDES